MINQYQIIDYSYIGIPSIEVKGSEFHYLDLFEMVDRQQFMTTFYLMNGSESRKEYGKSKKNGYIKRK
jgi:glutaredoxin-related protein